MYRQSEKNLENSNISSTHTHNMANFDPLAAEICWQVGALQQISTGFASWQHYCTALYTLCLKKGYHPTTIDNFNNSCPIPEFFVQILLSKYAIERWFDIPPRLFIVRTLPWKTLRPRKSQVQQ